MESVYTEESIKKLSEAEFYERFGVGSVFFGVLLDRLKQYREEEHAQGGRPNRLSVFQCLIIFFLYVRQYMTQTILADMAGVKKWDVSRADSLGFGHSGSQRLLSSYRKPENQLRNFCAHRRDGNLHSTSETQSKEVLFRQKEASHDESSNHI